MKIIGVDQFYVPENRQRQTFNEKALQDLASSILGKGLLHPPVVRRTDQGFALVAGERRYRAILGLHDLGIPFRCDGHSISPGFIPVTLLEELDELGYQEAELEENVIREDLTWQEKASAIAALHDLRVGQAASRGEVQTLKATAAEIQARPLETAQTSPVSDAVIVAKHLADPDVAKAKSTKEALKVIEKKAAVAHREVLAKQFDLSKTSHTLHHGDSFAFSMTLADKSFDVMIGDPPYGIGADSFGSMAGEAHSYADDVDYAMECYRMLAVQGFRTIKEKGHCYIFLDPRHWSEVSFEFVMAGWDVWPTPLIWSKGNGMLPRPDHGPRRTYEMMLFATKGGKKVHKVGGDVFNFPLVSDRDHGAQKPVPLYKEMLLRTSAPGDSALDLFAGSGTILPACNDLRMTATICERSDEYYPLCVSRVDTRDELHDLTAFLGES
jgi:DNA modification methylase